jgi:DNA-binding MarR family transcriptional regulator
MLTKTGIAVIEELASGRTATASELAEETGHSRTHIYRVLDDLRTGELLTETRTTHNQRKVRLTDHPVVEAYRTLALELGHVEWAELLSPATLRVCWYLAEPRRVVEIADRLDISRQAVHEALSPLKDRAMLSPDGPEYALADDLQPLVAFVRSVVEHEHRQRTRSLAPSATVTWCDPKRALVRSHDSNDTETLRESDVWSVTGLAAFRQFGLDFFLSDEPAFWYSPTELTVSDIVCHTLVLGADTRRTSYAMLLVESEAVEREELLKTAEWYGLRPDVSVLYRALGGDFEESDGTVSIPSKREYRALREQYGIV